MTFFSVTDAYDREPGLQDDPEQRAVVRHLEKLQHAVRSEMGFWPRLKRFVPFLASTSVVRGLYLCGSVGRGKTLLMDLFFETLPIRRKKRIHFHRMMSDVHKRLGALVDQRDPLDLVAEQIAAEVDVLCFDEFFVSDIGDAMILGRLLQGLFERGVTLVTTSNLRPDELYAGGLQRERFLPAIALLNRYTTVVEMNGGEDYRLTLLQRAGTYLTPLGNETNERLEQFFTSVAHSDIARNRQLDINGRPIAARRAAKGVAWFDFTELCDGPRSQVDYIEVARWYHTVIVSDVPQFGADHENAARRFVALVDEFYDRRVKLVLSAAVGVSDLYAGNRLKFEFQRTISRLTEMQSQEYLHEAHRA